MSDPRIGEPVQAWCACGPTWVFLGWPMRPCGRCREHVRVVDKPVGEWHDASIG